MAVASGPPLCKGRFCTDAFSSKPPLCKGRCRAAAEGLVDRFAARENGSLPESPSFLSPKRKRKSATVSRRWTPTRAAAFPIVPGTIGKTTRSVGSAITRPRTAANGWARNLASLRCGHLTTAFSPAGAGEQGMDLNGVTGRLIAKQQKAAGSAAPLPKASPV